MDYLEELMYRGNGQEKGEWREYRETKERWIGKDEVKASMKSVEAINPRDVLVEAWEYLTERQWILNKIVYQSLRKWKAVWRVEKVYWHLYTLNR